MKLRLLLIHIGLVSAITCAQGQGTFVFDQQSSTDETPFPDGGRIIQELAPGGGQSFKPGLPSVDFIRLKLYDNDATNGLGAVLHVNLRTNSISGSILATTDAISFSNGFADVINFFFSTNILVTPGATYFFEPVVQSGDSWKIELGPYNYPGGMAFSQGIGFVASDLWFREGIMAVPEPASAWLLLLGGGVLLLRRRKRCV